MADNTGQQSSFVNIATIKMEPEAVPDYTETRAPAHNAAESGPPPPYEAVVGKLKNIKNESNSQVDYGRRVTNYVFCNTCCSLLWALILLALPIAMIVVGARGLHNCTIQRYVPIYLIVAGAFGVLKAIANIAELIFHRKKGTSDEERKPANPFDGCVNLFLFAWFIAGSYWVYSIHQTYDGDNPNSEFYCERNLYLFAFWIITISYIFMALSLLMCICGCCCLTFCGLAFGSKEPENQ